MIAPLPVSGPAAGVRQAAKNVPVLVGLSAAGL